MIGISGQQLLRPHVYGTIRVTGGKEKKKKNPTPSRVLCRCRKVLATGHGKEEAHDKLLYHALRNTGSHDGMTHDDTQ